MSIKNVMGGGDSSNAQHWSRIMDKVMETSDWIAIFSKGSMVLGLGPRRGFGVTQKRCGAVISLPRGEAKSFSHDYSACFESFQIHKKTSLS